MIQLPHEQRTFEWHLARRGMVTGTTLHRATDTPAKQKTFSYELVSQMMTDPLIVDLNTAAVVRGRELEPVALKAASEHLGVVFEETGFLLSETIKGFGLSPDGIIRNDEGKIVGGIEMKCPDSKKHVQYMIQNELPSEYKFQVYAPFVADDDVQSWYFVSFDDRNYERPLWVTEIRREDIQEDVDKIRIKLVKFIEQVKQLHENLTF